MHPSTQSRLTSTETLGKSNKSTPANPIKQPSMAEAEVFWRRMLVCSNKIIIGPVADRTAAIPEATYCSAQYNVENVPKVNPIPVSIISLRKSNDTLALPFHTIHKKRIRPARRKRIPAEKNGGAPASIPTLIARNVVPKIIHINK
ncbi:hypothetical protein D1872_244750 [compost metagenome]